ncbi:MAG: histidine kinase dimerization/phospho-acceptor domain-containing protein [Synechococcales bacterium]|nr:histidine kinase dimerization/phospho-acceptor domain-containing protein [Synechococcales bacterium]
MGEWVLPTLSQVLTLETSLPSVGSHTSIAARRLRADRQWTGAIAALEEFLLQAELEVSDKADPGSHTQTPFTDRQGLVLSGPLPVLSNPTLLERFATWSFTADPSLCEIARFFRLLPAGPAIADSPETSSTLPLLPNDPLGNEQFCLVLTAQFSLILVLGEDADQAPQFWFSFDPEQVERAWQILRLRIVMLSQSQVNQLDHLFRQFVPVAPDYQRVTQFSHLLLANLPEADHGSSGLGARQVMPWGMPTAATTAESEHLPLPSSSSLDVELLQAIAHEVRTPLTTIRTLTRLLLRRKDMPADAIKRLEVIDRECSEQIDRFGLIFRAVELETCTTHGVSLTTTQLSQVFQQSIPRWQQQASQRGLTLDVKLPQRMPAVVSDPTMLDQALTSLIERSSRSLPAGSRIQVEVSLAGNQLKLQLETLPNELNQPHSPLLKSLGQMLTFQPETGVLSLNLTVTKNLFQALGGKLIVKQRSQQGEVFTIYLPLPSESLDLGLFDHRPTHFV